MLRNRALAMLLLSTLSSAASAAIVTVDAGNYNFSYDDSYWGTGAAFSRSGDLFTFSNLATNLGTSLSTASDDPFTETSHNFLARGDFNSFNIWITADDGYRVKSVLSGATGALDGAAGSHPLNTRGSRATAFVLTETQWYKGLGISYFDEGLSALNRIYDQGRNSLGELDQNVGSPGAYDMSIPKTFSDNVRRLAGNFQTSGWARAIAKDSWAATSLDSTYFSVEIAPALPVPEPETWAMFLAGLGMLGVLVRRRKATGN